MPAKQARLLSKTGKIIMSMKKHNFEKKIAEMVARGEVRQEAGKLYLMDVIHGDDCEMCEGGICNCDCEITITEVEDELEKV